MKKQSIWVFQWRKSVHYCWSYILFSPECKELTSMLDPLLYRWGVPPVVIRCVLWTMQMWVLQTWIKALGLNIIMNYTRIDWYLLNILNSWKFISNCGCKWYKNIGERIWVITTFRVHILANLIRDWDIFWYGCHFDETAFHWHCEICAIYLLLMNEIPM